jgi:uncharacterized protein involved in type VI secretion and phage assembly
VQYEESDWHFIERWLEHEGYSYWFEHGSEGETLVIADLSVAPDKTLTLHYCNASMVTDQNRESTLHRWSRSQRRTVRRVGLIDYDVGQRSLSAGVGTRTSWVLRSADVPGTVLGAADGPSYQLGAIGSCISLGSYTDRTHAETVTGNWFRLVNIRAEEVAASRVTYHGAAQCRSLHAGTSFLLDRAKTDDPNPEGAYDSADDDEKEYFVTSIELAYGRTVMNVVKAGKGKTSEEGRYDISFTAVRASQPYRPPLLPMT